MIQLLEKVKLDLQKDLKALNKKMSIVQIIPCMNETYPTDNLIVNQYNSILNEICINLNIDLYQEVINSNPYNMYNDAREVIDAYNHKDDITGILYDCPFINDKFHSTIKLVISSLKDIECITPLNIGQYILNQQYETIPPILSTIELLMNEFCDDTYINRIGIIQPVDRYSFGFIPLHDPTSNTFILSTIKDDIFIDKDLSTCDIIISSLINSNKEINNDIVEWSDNINSRLSIDYGWNIKTFTPSINTSIYNDNTICFNLLNGLMDLYIYNSIKNMIRLYKLRNTY